MGGAFLLCPRGSLVLLDDDAVGRRLLRTYAFAFDAAAPLPCRCPTAAPPLWHRRKKKRGFRELLVFAAIPAHNFLS